MNACYDEIAQTIVTQLMTAGRSAAPVYRKDVVSQSDIGPHFPLIYIWGEDKTKGVFKMGVNPWIIEDKLAAALPRTDPNFDAVRDHIGSAIAQLSQEMILEMMREHRSYASHLFPPVP